MKIVEVAIEQIVPYENNPRNIAPAVDAVVESIREFGFRVPMVIDDDYVIVTGHTRYQAAKKLGLTKVPCVIASDLNEEQIKKFRLVDNKVSEFSLWDESKLVEELDAIDSIDMTAFGFETMESEIDELDFEFDSGEIDLGEFNDEKFDYECPECGFKFNA